MVKNPPAVKETHRDLSSIPGSGRSPGGGHGNPLQYSCLENLMDRGAWRAPAHGVAESWDTTERLSTHTHMHTGSHPCLHTRVHAHTHEVKFECQWSCPPGGSGGKSSSYSPPASRTHSLSETQGPFLCLQSQQCRVFRSSCVCGHITLLYFPLSIIRTLVMTQDLT